MALFPHRREGTVDLFHDAISPAARGPDGPFLLEGDVSGQEEERATAELVASAEGNSSLVCTSVLCAFECYIASLQFRLVPANKK